MNRRRALVGVSGIDDVDDGEIPGHAAPGIGDLQNFAIIPGLRIGALDARSRRRASLGKRPLVAGDLSAGTPRPRAVEHDLLTDECHMVRPGHGDDAGPVLAVVGLQQKRVAFDVTGPSRRHGAANLVMQVRPAPAVPLLAQDSDALPHLHRRAKFQRRIDGLEVQVAVDPTEAVEHADGIVARAKCGRLEFLQNRLCPRLPQGHRLPIPPPSAPRLRRCRARSDSRPALSEPFAAIHVGRLIGHLGRRGEPALADGVHHRFRSQEP